MTVTLRPYQVEAARAAWQALLAGQDPLVVMATGCGKSVVYADVARRWTQLHDTDVVVLAHRRELLDQARRHLGEAGVPDDRVHALSIQSLYYSQPPPNIGLVIYDEVHHGPAKNSMLVLAKFEDARILGLTATPDRSDGLGLGRVCDVVAYRYDAEQAIRDGYLAPVRRTRASSVRELQLTVGRRRTIVFADSVESSRRMAEALGPTAAHVDGTTPSKERARILAAFSSGALQFLCNCDLVCEGFDVPACEVTAVMRNVGSRGLLSQMLGRSMRPADGKDSCLLIQLPDARELGLLPPDHFMVDAEPAVVRHKVRRVVRRAGRVVVQPDAQPATRAGRFWKWLWG